MIKIILINKQKKKDGEQGEPILVKLSFSVKTCCSQQAVAITAKLLSPLASNTMLAEIPTL